MDKVKPKEEQIVFALTTMDNTSEMPMLLVGIPTKAWEYMADGKTHSFDLTHLGLPVRFVLFGGKDHEEIRSIYTSLIERNAHNAPLDKDKLS